MKKNAFTLIELLVVISIVSLISSITFAGVQEGKEKAQDAKMKSEVTQVSRAVQQYKFDLEEVPGHQNVTPNVALIEGSDGAYAGDYELAMQDLVDEGYLSGIPEAPGEHVYTYLISDDGDQAVFGADLNNESSADAGRNSCSFTEELSDTLNTGEYPEDAYYVFYECNQAEASWYPATGQVEDEYSFFAVTAATIQNHCWCEAGAHFAREGDLSIGIFPGDLCREYMLSNTVVYNDENAQGCTNYFPSGTDYRLCRHDIVPREEPEGGLVDVACDGSDSTEYCQCL